MKLWKNCGRFFLTFLCMGPVWCPAESQREMENLLQKSVDYSTKTAFLGEGPVDGVELPLDSIIYGANGKVRFEYTGKVRKRKHVLVSDFEAQNEALWIEDESAETPPVVIVSQAPGIWNWMFTVKAMLQKDRLDKAVYSLADGEYDGKPCYELTAKYPTDDAAIAAAPAWHFNALKIRQFADRDGTLLAGNLRPDVFAEAPELFRANYYASIRLLIDKAPGKPFIYAFAADNPNGAGVAFGSWGKVEFPGQIDASKLTPFAGAKTVNVTGRAEFQQAYLHHYQPDFDRPPMLFPQLWDYFWSSPGGKLRLAGVLAVIGVIIGVVRYKTRRPCRV